MSDELHNRFAQGLVRGVATRAMGRDPGADRLVDIAPADYILTGFLTPLQRRAGGDTRAAGDLSTADEDETQPDREAELVDDVGAESAFEMPSIGFEWLLPRSALSQSSQIELCVSLAVYARVMPTQSEQLGSGIWQASELGTAEARLVRVWQRFPLPPISRTINLSEAATSKRMQLSLRDQFLALWKSVDVSVLCTHVLATTPVPREVAEDETRFATWLQSSNRGKHFDNWEPVVDIRTATSADDPACLKVQVRLVNATPPPGRTRQGITVDANLYDAQLVARVPDSLHQMLTFYELPNDYRYDRRMPVSGINVHATYEHDREWTFATDWIPVVPVDRLEPRHSGEVAPTFAALERDPVPVLREILAQMEAYDATDWAYKVRDLSSRPNAQRDAESDRARFQQDEIALFKRGIELLDDAAHPQILRAFTLMNRVMGTIGREARHPYYEWRLFQIVFIVRNLESLAARGYDDLARDETAEVLWFAAGGGKTEAFLGLIVWQLLFDRLRGKSRGMSAMVRFPLRLLAFQQLKRFARALAVADLVRTAEGLGGARFSLGYYVGSDTTPNAIDDDMHRRYVKTGPPEQYKRLFNCPFCGEQVDLRYQSDGRIIEHWCSSAATCPGGNRALPVLITDKNIYRFLPSVIVSTVDKMTVLGMNQRFTNLFGRFDMYCPKHGASFRDGNREFCAAAKDHSNRPGHCGNHPVEYGPFHDPAPALLVQDELHLLTEDLGTFAAHYESAITAVVASYGYKPWKIVAASATIERYDQHIHHLYLLPARRFPVPGPTVDESFYYVSNKQKIGRIYVGVLGVGRKHTPSVTRIETLIYQELRAAERLADQDLETALCAYDLPKGTTRDEFSRLLFTYELVLTYVLTRKGSDQVAEAIASRVNRDLRESDPDHGELWIEKFNSGVDTSHMLETMDLVEEAVVDSSSGDRVRGIIATNIISHGVDIDRFNVIIFAGFTRLVAEYIQASGRVGRTFPGISILTITPQSERDRSIYQRFAKFHEFVDRLVDPSAITRWPNAALPRTVPGLLAGYLMGVAARELNDRVYYAEDVLRHFGAADAECLGEDRIVRWMEEALGAERAPTSAFDSALEQEVRNKYSAVINLRTVAGQPRHDLWKVLGSMRSLRDTDEQGIISLSPDDTRKLRAMRRGRYTLDNDSAGDAG